MIVALSPCLMTLGCVRGFTAPKQEESLASTTAGMAQASDVGKARTVRERSRQPETVASHANEVVQHLPVPPSAQNLPAPPSEPAVASSAGSCLVEDAVPEEAAPAPPVGQASSASWAALAAPAGSQNEEAPWPNGFTAPPQRASRDVGNQLALQEGNDPILGRVSDAAPVPTEFVEDSEVVSTAAAEEVEEEEIETPSLGQAANSPRQEERVAQRCPPAACPMTVPCPPEQIPAAAISPSGEDPNVAGPIVAGAAPEEVPSPEGIPTAPQAGVPATSSSSNNEPLITLHADDLDVNKVMELISRQAKILNILVSPGVTGSVTVDLHDKTVDEALRIIATQCRLFVRREKDVIYISTLDEARKIEEQDLPMHVYRLSYVRSKDIEMMVKPLLSPKGTFTASPDSETGLTSDITDSGEKGSMGGTRKVDVGGNSLAGGDVVIVRDYEYILKAVDRLIAELDVQPVQVMIEAVIVQVTLDKDTEFGLNMSVLDAAGNAALVMGNGNLINTAAGFTPSSVLFGDNSIRTTKTTTNGVTSSTTTQSVTRSGKLSTGLGTDSYGTKGGWSNSATTGYIQALEGLGETKILACPRIFVLNKQRAEIHLGTNLGYYTTTVNQTSSTQTVSFLKTGTQLRLRPFVSSDGIIRMEVHPERSTGALDDEGIPQTKSSQCSTNVMVPDGGTMVIGGLIDDEVTQEWTGLPLLSRLPWVGYLFRHTVDATRKKELVVILTPHIWRPECPEATNYLGRPRTLTLEKRVAQVPSEAKRDGPSLYELAKPDSCAQPVPPGATTRAPLVGQKAPAAASETTTR